MKKMKILFESQNYPQPLSIVSRTVLSRRNMMTDRRINPNKPYIIIYFIVNTKSYFEMPLPIKDGTAFA